MDYADFVKQTLEELAKLPSSGDVLDEVLAGGTLRREGTWCEFGVAGGDSLRRIVLSAKSSAAEVWGFDSFEGLPEDWHKGTFSVAPRGSFKVDAIPKIPGARLVVGLFEDTLPAWRPTSAVTLVHVDCDLYSAAKCALEHVSPFLVKGSVIAFDELVGYPRFEEHEMLVLHEMRERGLRWTWLARNAERAALVVTTAFELERPPS